VAQLVEHNLAKVGVAGSNPVVRSRRGWVILADARYPENVPVGPDEQAAAAAAAGWNFADGDPPFPHGKAPPVDPELGTNGIPPTDAEQIA
jgi:hypothetical protein